MIQSEKGDPPVAIFPKIISLHLIHQFHRPAGEST